MRSQSAAGSNRGDNEVRQQQKQRQQMNEIASADASASGDERDRVPSSELDSQGICHFFQGRFVLVTGATGFLGKVVVEKLLYSCPAIGGIFLLIRPKKDKTGAQRLEEEFADSPLFERLRKRDPDFAGAKLRVIEGDVVAPNLGMAPEAEETLKRDVTVVIHCAATIRFDEKIKDAVDINVHGVLKLYSLCRRLPRLVSLVHVSTAYANCDRMSVLEAVYPPPPNFDNWLEAAQWLGEKDLEKVTPNIIGERPNTYTYTKSLAEHFLMEEFRRHPLPTAIVRPSIVGASAKEPFAGWVDNLNGATCIFAAMGKGLLRSMRSEEGAVADLIPVDYVANVLIAAAWFTAVKKPQIVVVYNCTSGQRNPITWSEVADYAMSVFQKCPLEGFFRRPKFYVSKSASSSAISYFIHQLLPAHVVDSFLRALGRKPYLVRLQNRVRKAVGVLEYFTRRSWMFESNNVSALRRALNADDRQRLDFDVDHLDWEDYIRRYVRGMKVFCLKEKMENMDRVKNRLFRYKIIWIFAKMMTFSFVFFHFWRRFLCRTALAKAIVCCLPNVASIYYYLVK